MKKALALLLRTEGTVTSIELYCVVCAYGSGLVDHGEIVVNERQTIEAVKVDTPDVSACCLCEFRLQDITNG